MSSGHPARKHQNTLLIEYLLFLSIFIMELKPNDGLRNTRCVIIALHFLMYAEPSEYQINRIITRDVYSTVVCTFEVFSVVNRTNPLKNSKMFSEIRYIYVSNQL